MINGFKNEAFTCVSDSMSWLEERGIAASIKVALGIRNWQLNIGSNWAFGHTKFTAVFCFSDKRYLPSAQFPMPKATFIETAIYICGARFVFKVKRLKTLANSTLAKRHSPSGAP